MAKKRIKQHKWKFCNDNMLEFVLLLLSSTTEIFPVFSSIVWSSRFDLVQVLLTDLLASILPFKPVIGYLWRNPKWELLENVLFGTLKPAGCWLAMVEPWMLCWGSILGWERKNRLFGQSRRDDDALVKLVLDIGYIWYEKNLKYWVI